MSDSENAVGRGSKAFDPYQASNSGAIRLSLQQFNGCAVMPNGQMAAKNSTPIPYPDNCPNLLTGLAEPTKTLIPPTGTLKIQSDTTYFLNQFTITESVVDEHTNPDNLDDAINWMKTQSRFKSLDWSNLSQVSEEWLFAPAIPGARPDSWTRHVIFDNPNWRTRQDDTFTLEVLDSEGQVRGEPVTYARSEFVADSAWPAGHSRITWRMEHVLPPRFPGDTEVRPVPPEPGWPPFPPLFRTLVRMDLDGSTNPFKTFRIPRLTGDGAIRVTWSQMPQEPFYFPVTFVQQTDLPPTCQDDAGNPTPCGFGLTPNLRLSEPSNGKGYYEPGEQLQVFIDIRDGDGNRLHAPDRLPTGEEVVTNQSNGLLYAVIPYLEGLLEYNMIPVVQVAGPLHKMKVPSDPRQPREFFGQTAFHPLVDEAATLRLPTGLFFSNWPTYVNRTLPEDAEPGTYVALVKANRYFLGERTAKITPVFFQVGQKERTTYPGDVGNCQICHRGVLSLDNLRHGLPVDHIESCKLCHMFNNDVFARPQEYVHKIHMTSPRYPADRADCTMCHLTRESALRPSVTLCSSCHPSTHGDEYFKVKFSNTGEPSRFGNCAEACHGNTPPKSHILPAN